MALANDCGNFAMQRPNLRLPQRSEMSL